MDKINIACSIAILSKIQPESIDRLQESDVDLYRPSKQASVLHQNDMKKLKNGMRWKMNKQYEMELI